jgi:outer membrane protein OmpA-like peptidoglycan-associated protein
MRRMGKMGVLVLAVLVFTVGCGSMDWNLFGRKDSQSGPRGEDAKAGAGEAQPGQPETQVVAVPAGPDGRTESVEVLFAFARWELSEAVRAELLTVVKKLQENPKLSVQLEGYTDSSGVRDKNLQLSQKRVDAVRRFLVEKGVEAARIRAAALGQLPDGGTEEERAKNRRVTVKLTTDTASR